MNFELYKEMIGPNQQEDACDIACVHGALSSSSVAAPLVLFTPQPVSSVTESQ